MGVAIIDLKHLDNLDRLMVAKVVAANDITPSNLTGLNPMDVYVKAIGWTILLFDLYGVLAKYRAPTQHKRIIVRQWIQSVDAMRPHLPQQKETA